MVQGIARQKSPVFRNGFFYQGDALLHSRKFAAVHTLPSFALLLLIVCPVIVHALGLDGPREITQYVQTGLTDKSGLPQDSVNTIAQTSDGYLWFGTEEGLARFDGIRTEVFDTIRYKTLKDNYIQAITAGRDGSLWIGSRTGLARFKDGVFESYLVASSPINKVYEAKGVSASLNETSVQKNSGLTAPPQIWVGSVDGLYAVNGHNLRHFTTADGLPANAISSIVQTTDGTLWIGTRKGIARLVNGAFRPLDLPAGPINALEPGHDGSLWIATSFGLFRWKDKILETIPASSFPQRSRINSLHEDHDQTLWIGFDHSGIAALRKGQIARYTAKQGLPSDDVSSIFEDREGHIWIGLFEGGVIELRDGSFSTFGKREGLSEDMIWSVLQARDKSVWVGTNSKGLDHIDRDGTVRNYSTRQGLSSDTVYALSEALDGSVWIGAEDGSLNHLQNGRISVFRDPAAKGIRLASILQDATTGDLLLAYHQVNGLVRFHEDSSHHGNFQHYTVAGLLNTATVAPDGAIWVGTDHGGVSRIFNGQVTNTYTTQNGLLTNFAQAVYIDRQGVVWAGTSPGGLNRIKDGRITTYSIDQGLFDLTVGAIVEDNSGYLWMTCNKGIYKVRKKELDDYAEGRIGSIHSIVYGNADGLRNVECNFAADPSAWKGADGRLWFATTAGVASVDPNQSQIRTHAPSLLVERVFFNQKSLPLGLPSQAIVAGTGSGDMEIQFTAPDFVAPQRIRFRYRLVGSDTAWVDAGDRRQAFYTKLPPGRYRFEVQDAIVDQNWSSDRAQIEIVLEPHFWQTDFFRGLCALALMLLCVAGYRVRVRYLVEHNRVLEERVCQRTAELQQAIQVTEAAHRALHEQATRDSLTGLWNRRSIFEMLGKEVSRAQRESHSIAVLMADVDHFKLVNDNHGHLTGDTVLQTVANRIGELTRGYDFAGRYGGEEFVIVLPGCSLGDGLKRAEEFRAAIADAPIQTASGPLHITCSFGVAIYINNIPAEELIHKADEALYSAKRSGRNRVHTYPLSLNPFPLQPEFSPSV